MPHDNIFINVCILIMKSPLTLLWYLFKHRKILVFAVIIIIGIAVYRSYTNSQTAQETPPRPIPAFQEKEPAKELAPQVLQTITPDSVYYLAKGGYLETSDAYLLKAGGYYLYINGKWEIATLPLPLEKDHYRKIMIYNR
jgi:hypothetical protein